MRLSPALRLGLAVGSVVLLGACSGGGSTTASSATPTSSASSSATPSASADAPGDGDGSSAKGDGAECLTGTWAFDLDVMKKMTASLPSSKGLDMKIVLSGETLATFADGVMTTEYKTQTSKITMDIEGKTLVTGSTQNGSSTAKYSIKGAKLTTSDVNASKVTLTTSTTIDGAKAELPGVEDATRAALSKGTTSKFTCSGDLLTLVPDASATIPGPEKCDLTQVLHRRK